MKNSNKDLAISGLFTLFAIILLMFVTVTGQAQTKKLTLTKTVAHSFDTVDISNLKNVRVVESYTNFSKLEIQVTPINSNENTTNRLVSAGYFNVERKKVGKVVSLSDHSEKVVRIKNKDLEFSREYILYVPRETKVIQ